jgi:D-alanine-D-alanine ligase
MPVTEVVPKKEFFDYEANTPKGSLTRSLLPGCRRRSLQRIQELSSEIYDILGCRGIVQGRFHSHGRWSAVPGDQYNPGHDSREHHPAQAAVFGISQTDLYSMVIEDLFTMV